LKLNPQREVEYRAQLAREYFEDAENSLRAGNFRGCVQSSQLATENAAKAVIATRRAPSWGHDPSTELLEVAEELDAQHQVKTTRLAELSSQLAPEHGRATYGEPERFITPRMLYDLEAAEKAIALAREAVEIMNQIVRPGSE